MHNSEQEILQRFSFFSCLLPAVHGDDAIMPPAIVVFLRLDTLHNIDRL